MNNRNYQPIIYSLILIVGVYLGKYYIIPTEQEERKTDSIIRLIPGVLNNYESARSDSFFSDLLDGPHYTRPEEYRGLKVPEILLSGHHENIQKWQKKMKEKKTKDKRPDMWKKYNN